MKQCTQCGAYSDDSAKFCTSCGQPFGTDAAEIQPAYYAADESIIEAPAPKVATKKEFIDLPENAATKKMLKTSGILCYVCAGFTLLAAFVTKNPYMFLDVVILLVLGLFIHLKQSKACAIILLLYSIFNVVYLLITTGKFQGYLILIAAIYAVTSAFKLDKAWKAYRAK